MGWRADKAYEEAQAKAYREWKASLTWGEYLAWQWDRWQYFVLGALPVAVGFLIAELVLR